MSEKDILDKLQPLANVLKVAVEEIWKILIRRYVAKAISEIVLALIVIGVSFWKIGNSNWIFLPLGLMLLPIYDGINLLVSPAYYALREIMERVK